jgi:flagellar biosynthesis/type III secretory pathway chaperone
MSPQSTNTAQLAELVAAKQQVLEILVRLSRRQVLLIGAGDMTSLLKLLGGKQTVMHQLQAIEQGLAPFRDEDPEQRIWPSPAHRAACQARADRCNALLAEAMQLEQQAEAAMVGRRDEAAAALATVQTATDARSAYAALPPANIASLQVEG